MRCLKEDSVNYAGPKRSSLRLYPFYLKFSSGFYKKKGRRQHVKL